MSVFRSLVMAGGDRPPRNQVWYWAEEQVTLYNSTKVVSHTFANGKGILTLTEGTTYAYQWLNYTGITRASLPEGITSERGFYNCTRLSSVSLPKTLTTIVGLSFGSTTSLKSIKLPAALTTIGDGAFDKSGLVSVVIPANVTTIGNKAFANCTSLTSVTFLGTPTNLYAETDRPVFYACNALSVISVPWAEGAVSGAPWGATNATINYNYTA